MPSWNRDGLLTLLLAAVAVALAVAVGAEWMLLDRARGQDGQPPPARATGTLDAPPVAAPDFSLPALEAYPETVNRPLFMENRRPGVDVAEAPPPPPPATPLNLKLMGIVHTPTGKTALLMDGKGKYQRKKPGDTLDGWVLVEIDSDRLTVQQGDKREQITLLKKRPKPPNAPPQAQVPGQPQPPRPGGGGGPGQAFQPPQAVGMPAPANLDNDVIDDGDDGSADPDEDTGNDN